jgi:hypothetical protein
MAGILIFEHQFLGTCYMPDECIQSEVQKVITKKTKMATIQDGCHSKWTSFL